MEMWWVHLIILMISRKFWKIKSSIDLKKIPILSKTNWCRSSFEITATYMRFYKGYASK